MVRIITDSTSSIPADIRRDLGIEVISLHVERSGVEYAEATMDLDAFYRDIYGMSEDEDIPTSSQPSATDFMTVMGRAAEAGDDVLGLFISSRMSGTFENALRAAKAVAAAYPGWRYVIGDSMSNCLELGWPVIEAARVAKVGGDLQDCLNVVKVSTCRTRFVFAPESLRFLRKGGRIGAAAALIGGLIKLSPVLTVRDGVAATHAKARTQKNALAKISEVFQSDVGECGLREVAVHYIGDRAPAEVWAHEVIEPLVGHEVLVCPASPVIGVHVGPAMGLAYECELPLPAKFTEVTPEFVGNIE